MALMSQMHERLARELAELPDEERRAVVAAASSAAYMRRVTTTIRAAAGAVEGQPADAIEDTERLYDES